MWLSSYKIYNFIKRDFFTEASYKLSFIFNYLHIFFSIAIFYFISKLLPGNINPYLAKYSGGYFSFVFIGITFFGYLSMALRSFSQNIRQEQMIGTLEAMLVTPTKTALIVVCLALWDFVFGVLNMVIYLVFGICFFGFVLTNINILSTCVILILTVVSFSSIGIISAAFVLYFKKGDPIAWLISLFSGFLGSVYFPVEILPISIQKISFLIPVTYALDGLRRAILNGESLGMLVSQVTILFIFCLVLFPLSIFIFKYALRKAKIAGSLAHY